jgi:enamine deaminase RidA (YjgF/YER057c/UK114 family)
MPGQIDKRLAELGIELPNPSAPAANYVPFVVSGPLVFVAGQVAQWNGERRYKGRAGDTLGVEEAYAAARLCGLNLLAHLRVACGGDLDRVRRVVRLGGFVASAPDFTDQPKCVNGASDLMVEVFGKDIGSHARTAVGVAALPGGVSVEVDGIFELSR